MVNFLGVQIEVSERVAVGILQNAEGKAKQPEKGPAVQAAAAAAAAQLPPDRRARSASAARDGAGIHPPIHQKKS